MKFPQTAANKGVEEKLVDFKIVKGVKSFSVSIFASHAIHTGH